MTNNTFIENLKNGFEQIIQYHVEKGELHQRAENEILLFIDYLLNQTAYTKGRLAEVIEKYNYDTIKPDEQYNVWPDIEFWRGMGEYSSALALNYDSSVDILKGEEIVVIGRYENYEETSDADKIKASKEKKSTKINLIKYPISLLGHYEYKFNETALFYAWMGYLWQEIEGHKCGIKVKIVQNNSIATFSLNDFIDGDFSAFMEGDYGDKPPKLNSFFPRKLSLIEIYLRASQSSYPFNHFKNYWRYFEKDNAFIEIVTYELLTGIRSGSKLNIYSASVNQIVKHEDSKSALNHIKTFTNQMIFDGWEEKLRPLDLPERMHENAFDFEIWTGIYWTEEQRNMLPEARVKNFETEFKIHLPKSFFHYLRLLNGRQYNKYHMHFPIDDLYTVQVKKFFTIDELESTTKSTITDDSNHLWIGELADEKLFGINIDISSEHYEKIVLKDNDTIDQCDYSFERFAKYAQGSSVQPEIYAAEENDVVFLRKRLDEGWGNNSDNSLKNAVTTAAENNSHEALEMLLETGARLNHNRYREMPYVYDAKTIEILDKYQKWE